MSAEMRTYVLIHGAWHGGWCWEATADHMRGQGHHVFAPTMIGLAERKHLLTPDIDLGVMIDDMVQYINDKELNDIILVGHSFAGAVITGIADQIPNKLHHLVYLDAAWLENGQSIFDTMEPEAVSRRVRLANSYSNGLSIPPPPVKAFGVNDASLANYLEERLTPHPVAGYSCKLKLNNLEMNGVKADYIYCTEPTYKPLRPTRESIARIRMKMHALPAPHGAMITHPIETAKMILELG